MPNATAFTPTDPTSTTQPPLGGSLEAIREEVERVLESLPDNRLDARRILERELQIEPSAEELQLIVRVAHDPAGQGALRDLSRSALVMWLLAHREPYRLLEGQEVDTEHLARTADLMPWLVDAAGTLEQELARRVEMLGKDERSYLLQVADLLVPPQEPLLTAAVLAPRLRALAGARGRDALRAAVPSLTDEEIGTFTSVLRPLGNTPAGSHRIRINSLALRTIIRDDLAAWEALQDSQRDESADPEDNEQALARLERDVTAYRVLSEHIQRLQDEARVNGSRDQADELHETKKRLFADYRRLAATLNAARTAAKGNDSPEKSLEGLLEECESVQEEIAGQQSGKASMDELYVNALKKMREPATDSLSPQPKKTVLQRERMRLKLLSGIACTIFLAVIAVYGTLLPASGDRPEINVPTSELPHTLLLTRAVAVGPMLYGQVNRWLWNDLTLAQKLAQVNELGEGAAERGFETLYLADENNEDLARWTASGGAEIKTEPAPADDPASTDPASTDPASTDPASTGPASTGPAPTGPASTRSNPPERTSGTDVSRAPNH